MPATTATLQTPPGRGGIAVIFLTGPRAPQVLRAVFRPWRSHRQAGTGALQLGRFIDAGRTIDQAVIHRRGDGAEINIHAGSAVAAAVLELLARHGAEVRPAETAATGTFRPAHPRWSNPAIGQEMLEALPSAQSVLAAAAVTIQWSAGVSELAGTILDRPASPAGARGRPDAVAEDPEASALEGAAGGLATMDRLLRPAEVVLAGPPNVGKSTLANALVGRQVSIVHHAHGTTRDWVREAAVIHGIPIWLTDTAGLWRPPAAVDAEAVRRARHRIEQADVLLVLSAGRRGAVPAWCRAPATIAVASKSDVLPPAAGTDVAVSALTGDGLDDLRRAILAALGLAGLDPALPRAFTHRQASLLTQAADTPGHRRAFLRDLLSGSDPQTG